MESFIHPGMMMNKEEKMLILTSRCKLLREEHFIVIEESVAQCYKNVWPGVNTLPKLSLIRI